MYISPQIWGEMGGLGGNFPTIRENLGGWFSPHKGVFRKFWGETSGFSHFLAI